MKRHILLFALLLPVLSSCVIGNEEKSPHSDKNLEILAAATTEARFTFPMVLVETVLAIEDYENMAAEDKLEMTHVFNSLIKTSDRVYTMDRFYSFKLTTDGNSMRHDEDAEWTFESAWGDRMYYSSFAERRRFSMLRYPEDAGYDYFLSCDKNSDAGESIFMITELEDTDAYFSWKIEMRGSYLSDEGRLMEFCTDGPAYRKVYRRNTEAEHSKVWTEGHMLITIYDKDGNKLDELVYDLKRESDNMYYDF